jgi:hypothetical protein
MKTFTNTPTAMKKKYLKTFLVTKTIDSFCETKKVMTPYQYYKNKSFQKCIWSFMLFFFLFNYSGMSQMVHTGIVTVVYEIRVNLTALTRVRFEIRNLSSGSDPVINLLSPEGKGVMAANNGGPNFAEQLNYLPIRTGSYFLVVRSRTMQTKGTADLYKDGVSIASGISFGGWQVSLQNLRVGETLQTVKLPEGSNGVPRLYILKPDQIGIQLKAATLGSDIALTKISAATGNRTIVVGTNYDERLLRLVRNDAALKDHDPDKDGLGNELENDLGTCPNRAGFAKGFDCSTIADARDTDGDGISDEWEALGRYDVRPFQLLPKWGADPRHKDLFIEVDFMSRNADEDHDTSKMPVSVAKDFAAIYGDAYTTKPFTKILPCFCIKKS